MKLLYLVGAVAMTFGAFCIFEISPMQFTDDIFQYILHGGKGSLKDSVLEATGQKKRNILQREIMEAQNTLRLSNRSQRFPMICMISLSLFIGGVYFSATLGNYFLVPIMAFGLAMIPFWYLKLSSHNYLKDIANQLETALSIITSAYMRNEDILTAVKENLNYLNPPISKVFEEFVIQIEMVDPDITKAIRTMKEKINNDVFQEWCDELIACQYDRGLKTTLPPIINKLSDMRTVNAELEYLVFNPRKEFITMVVMVISNIPLLYFLNRDWYNVLMHTVLGQILLAITFVLIFFSCAKVIQITRPIEYKR